MGLHHFFDWKGFSFVGKILLAAASAGALLHAGLFYARMISPTSASELSARAAHLVRTRGGGMASATFSTTTPLRTINALSIADAVPANGKFIVADLENMALTLYEDGSAVSEYPILTKGKPGSPFETPAGFYNVLSKETGHFNYREQVFMPYSMQFYGNYFIHGWPYYLDGTEVASAYSGGCIRLSTVDAEKVFDFAKKGTGIFVYDPSQAIEPPSLVLSTYAAPAISADSYLVADADTGDVFLEKNAGETKPIASVTKLMTALVANETIMFNNKITITREELLHREGAPSKKETFVVGDLLYPLLMESNNAVADRLAGFYGKSGFVRWMNTAAKALDMQQTHFSDASGISSENVSTPDDLYRLATYLVGKKSFIFDITRTPTITLTADSGNEYLFKNFNIFSGSSDFVGGKVGQTAAAQETMVSVFSLPINNVTRRAVIVVLKSNDYTDDTTKLAEWFMQSAKQGAALASAACVSCTRPAHYRKIQ
jgi:serine-type D-Ala-D-Ala carboxypeptidase (penicillin-binding protein 5/6)